LRPDRLTGLGDCRLVDEPIADEFDSCWGTATLAGAISSCGYGGPHGTTRILINWPTSLPGKTLYPGTV